jgi:hypothetical protein
LFKNLTLVICLCAVAARAQTDKKPWQGTFTKTTHPVGATRIFLDLPLPPAGRVLTLERVGITIGPTLSIYGRVYNCEIESARPRLSDQDLLESHTRVMLPLPIVLGTGTRTWAVIHAPVRIYAEPSESGLRELFRVSCAVDAIAQGDNMTVTAVGYTTPK